MSVETDIYSALSGDTTLVALVGDDIYPDRASAGESTRQFVVYERTATRTVTTIHGTVAATQTTMQISCVGPNRQRAEAIADAAVTAIGSMNHYIQNRAADYDPETESHVTAVVVVINE